MSVDGEELGQIRLIAKVPSEKVQPDRMKKCQVLGEELISERLLILLVAKGRGDCFGWEVGRKIVYLKNRWMVRTMTRSRRDGKQEPDRADQTKQRSETCQIEGIEIGGWKTDR